jgi:hypothetical protein
MEDLNAGIDRLEPFCTEVDEIGVMELWSNGVPEEQYSFFPIISVLQNSTTPYRWMGDKKNLIQLSRNEKLTDNWKRIAWNGIQFKAPADWEASKIDSHHLILERGMEPVMEIKWGTVKGRFSHKTHLKRLVSSHSKKLKGRIAEWFLPPPWEKALAGFETRGFLWQADKTSGRGAILYCRACHNATLIQFIGESSAGYEKVLLTILKSFRDHRQDSRILWSIFDIRVRLPEQFKLLRYRFEAGKYELAFNDGVQKIFIQRWAPAAAILDGRDLNWFRMTIPELATGNAPPPTVDHSNAIEWNISPAGKWRRMLCRLKAGPSYFWFRLWHLEDKNRILSVRAESKYPLDFQLLNRICAVYDSL